MCIIPQGPNPEKGDHDVGNYLCWLQGAYQGGQGLKKGISAYSGS